MDLVFSNRHKGIEAGGTESGASLKEPEVENVSLILLILLQRKKQTCPQGFVSAMSRQNSLRGAIQYLP